MAVAIDVGQKKSFADILNSGQLNLLHEGTTIPAATQMEGLRKGLHRGKPAAFFSSNKLSAYGIPFKWALIGKFSQGRPRMEDIHNFFVSLDLKGGFKLGLLDNRHIVMNFDLEKDFHRIFSRMSWNVFHWPMRVFKYTVNFHVNKESSIVPIWINLEKLPLVLFNKEALFTIASLIGTPLRLDTATAEVKRPSVARMQVEIDLLKPVPDMIWIGMGEEDGFWQDVKYENLPAYCSYCWHLGHSETHCIIKHPELKEVTKTKPKIMKTVENIMTHSNAPQVEKIYCPKVMQAVERKEDAGNISQKQPTEVEEVQQHGDIEKEEGWMVVQSRKAKKIINASESLIDYMAIKEKTCPSSSLVVDVPESSSARNNPNHMMLQLMKEKPNDDHKNEANSDQNVEESNGQQLHQSQLYESDLSKAMVVYSQDHMEEVSTEVPKIQNIEKLTEEEIQKLAQESISEDANELVESIADKVVKEHSPNFQKKSHAKRVSFRLPQDTKESSSQPLQSVFSSRPQVTDLAQEEIQNLVQEGIIVDEGSKDDPALEFHNDDEKFEEELDEVVERGNLSPRISDNKLFSTKGSRSRRKNNRYRDFYC